jgi:hypothetical protein
MLAHRMLPFTLAAVLLAVLGLSPLEAAASEEERSGSHRLADPGARGPYQVGFRFTRYLDATRNPESSGRTIPVHLFYPVDPADVGPTTLPASYPLDTLYGLYPEASSLEFEAYGIDRAWAAPRPSSRAPFPLLVFSPGWTCDANLYLFVGTRLASHGFVVAIVSHQGELNSPVDTFDHSAQAAANRPRDVSLALTRLLEENRSRHGPLHGLINPARIAAGGHSYGGYAAMVLGGAGDDAICDGTVVDDWWMGPPPPEACVSSAPDRRFRALLLLDGTNSVLRLDELARIKIPYQWIGQDETSWSALPPSWGSWQARLHAAAPIERGFRADLRHAVHMSFSNLCAAYNVYFQNGIVGQAYLDQIIDSYCRDTSPILVGKPLIPEQEANRLSTKLAIPFLKAYLAGDERYERMVSSCWVNSRETDVAFFETERGGTTHQGPGADYLPPTWVEEFDYYVDPPKPYCKR